MVTGFMVKIMHIECCELEKYCGRFILPLPLPQLVFDLNNQPMSILECEGQKFTAFSGNGIDANNLNAVGHKNNGPLPPGLYYIVDRESGGRLGRLRNFLHNESSGSDNNDWFALWKADGTIDDWTFIYSVQRGNFRLHPAGVRRVSYGCITLPSKPEFHRLRSRLRNTSIISLVPGTNTRFYGTVLVKPADHLVKRPVGPKLPGR